MFSSARRSACGVVRRGFFSGADFAFGLIVPKDSKGEGEDEVALTVAQLL